MKKSQKAADTREKKKRAAMKQIRDAREEALREKEGTTYEARAF